MKKYMFCINTASHLIKGHSAIATSVVAVPMASLWKESGPTTHQACGQIATPWRGVENQPLLPKAPESNRWIRRERSWSSHQLAYLYLDHSRSLSEALDFGYGELSKQMNCILTRAGRWSAVKAKLISITEGLDVDLVEVNTAHTSHECAGYGYIDSNSRKGLALQCRFCHNSILDWPKKRLVAPRPNTDGLAANQRYRKRFWRSVKLVSMNDYGI